jgi:hypothetical protein
VQAIFRRRLNNRIDLRHAAAGERGPSLRSLMRVKWQVYTPTFERDNWSKNGWNCLMHRENICEIFHSQIEKVDTHF